MNRLEALYLISAFANENGYAISYRELSDALGVSLDTVHRLLASLRADALVDFNDREGRTVHLTNAGKSVLTYEQVFGIMQGIE